MSGLIIPYEGVTPEISPTAFIAPDATVVGRVKIGPMTGVWYKCVIRGDEEPITIGANCNIQDGTVIHVAGGDYSSEIGDDVSIGHMALIHACTLESNAFVGMRAAVMDGAVVESGAILAAGALLTPGKRVPTGELWAGSPAKFMRKVGPADEEMREIVREAYLVLLAQHKTAIEAAGLAGPSPLAVAGSDD